MIWAQEQASQQKALFNVDISSKIGKEYVIVIDDIIRMLTIQFVIQLMLFVSGATEDLFSAEYILVSVYIVLGVAMYWLVLRNLVKFN